MKEYYKIGEISNLYGICTDSLRYYEKIGILKPKRDANGYRMYSIRDIRILNILRDLRSVGFSVGEIKKHLAGFDLEGTLNLFRGGIDAIDKKNAELKRLRKQLTERIAEINSHISKYRVFGKPAVKKLKERKILQLSGHLYRDENIDFVIKKLQKENEDQLYLIGNGDIGATIPLKDIERGKYGNFNSAFCISEGNYDSLLPPGEYLCSVIKGSYSLIADAWRELFRYAETCGLEPAGDAIELYIIDNHDTNNEDEYITQLQLPVR